jgi:hypothetical protein
MLMLARLRGGSLLVWEMACEACEEQTMCPELPFPQLTAYISYRNYPTRYREVGH